MKLIYLLFLCPGLVHAVPEHRDYVDIMNDARLPWVGRCPTVDEYDTFFTTTQGKELWHGLDFTKCSSVKEESDARWVRKWEEARKLMKPTTEIKNSKRKRSNEYRKK